MPERATVFTTVQVGVETTPGTSVAANKKFQSISIDPGIQVDIKEFLPSGTKFPVLEVLNKEWVLAPISGAPTYTELVYLLSSVLAYQAPVQIIPPTGLAYKWTFEPKNAAADTVKTYTVEQGSTERAHKFTYGLVNSFGIRIDRDGLEVSGQMLGQRLTDNIVLTVSPTSVELVPILPTQCDVFMDPTHAALGTTKLTRVLEAEWRIENRFGVLFVIDSSQTSWVAHVELRPQAYIDLLLEADAQGMGLLSNLRNGDTRFFRIQATGANIEAGPPSSDYRMRIDMAGKVSGIQPFRDEDGVFTIPIRAAVNYDSGWTKALSVELINKLSTL